jgi:tellurite resistance protein TehA-like permease
MQRAAERVLRHHPLWKVSLASGDPALGALTMGSITVATDLRFDGLTAVALVPFIAGAACWALLTALFALRLARDRDTWREQSGRPTALTGVAATAVLGFALHQFTWTLPATIALAAAALAWPVLLPRVLLRWHGRSSGAHFMLTVATESLATLAANLALWTATGWLLVPALALLVVGLMLYAVVLMRFHGRNLKRATGDHWIAGGALAITALAGASVTEAAQRLAPGVAPWLGAATLGIWVAAMTWLPVLMASDIIWPRLRYHVARWSTVFPVAMYAACSFSVGHVLAAGAIIEFARGWTWIGFAVWLVVFVGMLAASITDIQRS